MFGYDSPQLKIPKTDKYCQQAIDLKELKKNNQNEIDNKFHNYLLSVAKQTNIFNNLSYLTENTTENDSTAAATAAEQKSSKIQWPHISDSQFNQKITDIFSNNNNNPCSYVMQQNMSKSDTHACSSYKSKDIEWNDLSPYQRLITDYISPDTSFRGVLGYHGLGSGKTLVAIATIAKFLQKDESRTSIVLGKPSLKENFYTDVAKCSDMMLFGKKMDPEERKKIVRRNIIYVSYEELANRLCGRTKWDFARNHGKEGFGALKPTDVREDSSSFPLLNNTLVVIDEAHNLIKQLTKPKYPPEDAAKVVLDSIRKAPTCRMVFLTATPIQQKGYELGIMLNLLKPPNTPESEKFPEKLQTIVYQNHKIQAVNDVETQKLFDSMFLNKKHSGVELKNTEKLSRLMKGLISYYPVDFNKSQFAQRHDEEITYVQMSQTQLDAYHKKRKEEVSLQLKNNSKITCDTGSSADDDEDDDNDGDSENSAKASQKACFSSLQKSNFIGPYRKNIDEFYEKNVLEEYSPKSFAIIDNLEKRLNEGKGKQMVFSSTGDTGIYMLSRCLEKKGWTFYSFDNLMKLFKNPNDAKESNWCNGGNCEDINNYLKSALPKKKAFVVMDGTQTDNLYKTTLIKTLFNMKSNMNGEYVNTIILNSKYSEGLSLKHTTAVHLMDPPRSNALQSQIVARAIRLCSHVGLQYPDEWKVSVYKYMMIDKTFGTKGGNLSDSSNAKNENKKLKDYEFLDLQCSKFEKDDCNNKEYCIFDNDNVCKFASVETQTIKNANMKSAEIDKISKVMQENAIDCQIFSDMHDPNDKPVCHNSNSKLHLNNYYDVPKSAMVRKDKTGTEDFESDDIECSARKNQTSCDINPSCKWKQTDNIFSFNTVYCDTRYSELQKNKLNAYLNSVYKNKVTPFEISSVEETNDEALYQQNCNYFRQVKSLPEKLYLAKTILQYEKTHSISQNSFLKNNQVFNLSSKELQDPLIQRYVNTIILFENSNNLKQSKYNVDLMIDFYKLKSVLKTFHYQFQIEINQNVYNIDSKEMKDIGLNMNEVKNQTKYIVKEFQFFNLFINVTFLFETVNKIKYMSSLEILVYSLPDIVQFTKPENSVFTWNPSSYSTEKSGGVRNKNNQTLKKQNKNNNTRISLRRRRLFL